jgi:predicted amidophosphoribosyltransferase
LGTLLHFAKQGQNAMLMRIMIPEIQLKMDQLLQTHREIDAVAYVPPTIHRKLQLMDFLATHRRINRPHIAIQKIQATIQIPQKSLNKLKERINNADNSFVVFEQRSYNKTLLIDDAIGSGATINQIASKLKTQGVCKEIIGLAIVGSFKGFNVITDV